MSAPVAIVTAIGRAVEAQGGTLDDARHLLAEWERLTADKYGRVDRLHQEAASATCRCADGGAGDGRCERCCRLICRETKR